MQGVSAFIVEDDQSAHDLFAKIFTYLGFEIASLYDAEEAIAYLQENTPDLALIDMYLPGMNGLELLQFIREQEHLQDMVAILTSSDDTVKELSRDLADYVILKPINNQRMIDLLQDIVSE